jgi:hypothetical protein
MMASGEDGRGKTAESGGVGVLLLEAWGVVGPPGDALRLVLLRLSRRRPGDEAAHAEAARVLGADPRWPPGTGR